MPVQIRFVLDDEAARRALQQHPRQARFAAALALTRVAQEAQARVVQDLPDHFTIRSPWVSKGIRIVRANAQTLEATVLSKDDFMALQEEGGAKEPRSGKSVAVPIGARKTKQSITRPGSWPKALLGKRGYFIAPLATGGLYMGAERIRRDGSVKLRRSRSTLSEEMGLWKRAGAKTVMSKGRYAGQRRQPIKLMYALKEEVEVKPRFLFRETVEQVARERFAMHFQDALREALATARP
jgi:hypothetical protein